MRDARVEEKEIYCKRINGKLVCYRVVKADGNAIRLKNVDGVQPEFATTAEKLFKSHYIRSEAAPGAGALTLANGESPGMAGPH